MVPLASVRRSGRLPASFAERLARIQETQTKGRRVQKGWRLHSVALVARTDCRRREKFQALDWAGQTDSTSQRKDSEQALLLMALVGSAQRMG